jgi:hypothetical protein
VVTVVGLYLSVELDLSPGPTVVAFYASILAVMAVVVYVVRARLKTKALGYASIGIAVVLLIVFGVYYQGKLLASLGDYHDADAHSGIHHHHFQDVEHHRLKAKALEAVPKREQKTIDTSALEKATRGCVGAGKIRRYAAFPDELARLDFIGQKLGESERKGLGFLYIFLSDPESTGFYRSEGVALLKKHFQEDFGYNPELGPEENAEALSKICNRLNSLKRTADPATKKRRGQSR